ncbi:hypothetical protein ARMGADRAFT_1014193 [Armillaria gallica]|uniref:F-box domain-containing protein n=1 Tax=Armillaria gallica TaxID=47427 RepID=A0A2H3DRK4_ARMGA|nr:hypothetical protein ARMGADRAFT_1014193 [Armillaria gallica]
MSCPSCNVDQNLDYYSAARKTYSCSLEHSLEPFVLSNAVPSHNDCALIKDSLSSLSAKSAHLDDIIAQQDEAIAKLSLILDNYKDSREEMLSEQARVRDLLERYRRALSSPIRRQPVDIMREIFLLASSNAADIKDFAWIATHTCTEWRDIATQTPMLWSKLLVATNIRTDTQPYSFIAMPEPKWLRSTSKGASNAECVGRALELSQDVPLVISYVAPARRRQKELSDQEAEMLDMLLDHAPRWKVAYIDASNGGALIYDKLQRLRGRVPMLESISINTCLASDGSTYPDIFDVAPRLRTVTIRNSQGQLVFPWRQIRRLILNGVRDMSYFLHVLRSVKNVEHLTIFPKGGRTGLPSVTTNAGSSIILPAVHMLDVLSGIDRLFLPSELIVPALEKLKVVKGDADSRMNTITPGFTSQVGELLRSSGCVLTHATLLPIVDFGPAFEDVISQCPALTYLDIGFTPSRENIDKVFSFINRPNILPALQTLKIAFRNCTLAEHGRCIGERFVQTALSRKHSSLRIFKGSVHITADKKLPYTPFLSATDKASLEELKAEGMSITVRGLIPVYEFFSNMNGKRTGWKQFLEFA